MATVAPPVTPVAGINSFITTGGDDVIAVPGGPNGGYITNPSTAADQNISPAEWLYVDPVTNPILGAYGTTTGLAPGSTYSLIAGQTTVTRVNAATAGHRFTVVWF